MNFYLFVDPQYNDYSDSHVWQNNLYALALWESSEKMARELARSLDSGYNALTVRWIATPANLATKKIEWEN